MGRTLFEQVQTLNPDALDAFIAADQNFFQSQSLMIHAAKVMNIIGQSVEYLGDLEMLDQYHRRVKESKFKIGIASKHSLIL